MNKSARLSLERICWFVIRLCMDLKDSVHLRIGVFMTLTHSIKKRLVLVVLKR